MISRGARGVIIVVAVVVAGGAGMGVGRWIAERRVVRVSHVASSVWQRGDAFPAINLQTEWGESVTTRALLARGGVVLFLDLECPPCVEMARKWNRAVDEGKVDAEQVVAITSQPVAAIARFRQDLNLQINVYRDPGPAFLSKGWITSFPVEVIVRDDGVVVSVTDDAGAPVDGALLQAALVGGN